MDVLNIEEQEDGSAIVTVAMTESEQKFLLEYAITNILREEIERMEKDEADLGSAVSDY